MRIVRYQLKNEPIRTGWIYEGHVGPIDGDIFGEYRRLEAEIPLESVRLTSPVLPGKIVCMGRNYAEHAREHGADVPETPLIFLKPSTCVISLNDEIVLPPQSQQVEHEGELAVVIGKRGRWIQAEDVHDYILGYTIANDVTARDLQNRDGQWTRAKGFDTFCPLGPWIETEFDPADALLTVRVNGEVRQMETTRAMVFPVNQIVAYISSIMTLEPGDVILTGTPAGVGPLAQGDIVTVEIDGIGELKNKVVLRR